MKIAHINYIPNAMTGVNKKIEHQAKAAYELGLDIDFIVLGLNPSQEMKNLKIIKIKSSKSIFFEKVKKLFFAYSLIDKNIDLKQYDYVVIRYVISDLSSLLFMNKYGDKVITEHHTNELSEILSYRGGLSHKLKYIMEKSFAPKVLSKVKGIIGVTDEIRQIELSRSNSTNKNVVISNGIYVEETKLTEFKKFDGKNLTMIFVATYTALWQGVNRVLDGLSEYNGSCKITFIIVGGVSPECREKISTIDNPNIEIKIVGEQRGDSLDNLFVQSNIAISSLALYKKDMKEACSLKSREYIARGVPFIYGYDDSDLDGTEEFALKVGADDEPLDIDKIIKFSQYVSTLSNISQIMRNFAKEKLDWKIKIQQMYDFITSIDRSS